MNNFNDTNINIEPESGAIGPVSMGKFKEYGKKAYTPLLNVVYKYQDQFTPYIEALSKGLQGGVEKLNQESSTEEEKYVARFFQEAVKGLEDASSKLKGKDINEFKNYLSSFADRHPSAVFGSSYIVGLFFGRLARHVMSRHEAEDTNTETFSTDQSIH